jgi:hypothetical protein
MEKSITGSKIHWMLVYICVVHMVEIGTELLEKLSEQDCIIFEKGEYLS